MNVSGAGTMFEIWHRCSLTFVAQVLIILVSLYNIRGSYLSLTGKEHPDMHAAFKYMGIPVGIAGLVVGLIWMLKDPPW